MIIVLGGLHMFSRIKSSVFLLSLLFVIALNQSFYGATRNSIELISDGDTLVLSSKDTQKLLKRLIDDPLRLLNELKEYEHELEDLAELDSLLSREIIQNKFKIYREKNPIFLIGECNSSMCGLSRYQNSSRAFYEKTIVSYLKKYKNQERINFVAFASGGLFQELIILTQAVSLHNTYNINIHLIDPKYGALIQALSTINNQSNVVNIASYNNFNFHDYSIAKESEAYRQQQYEKNLMFGQEQFRQFILMVKQLSDNNIRVFVHKSAQAYYEFCTQHPEMRADVISAMDLEPEFRYETAIKDYYYLIYHTLKKGGVAILADNDLGPEKLNLIDYVTRKAPNAAIIIKWSFLETMWKHIVDLSRDKIDSSLQHLNKFNTVFVGVHSKQAECSNECLQGLTCTFAECSNNYSALNAELKKLDNNEFISYKNEFQNISPTKRTLCASLLLASGIYIASRVKKLML